MNFMTKGLALMNSRTNYIYRLSCEKVFWLMKRCEPKFLVWEENDGSRELNSAIIV